MSRPTENKAAAESEMPQPPSWCSVLSVVAPALGLCGCLGTLVMSINTVAGTNLEADVSPAVLLWSTLALLGVLLAVAALPAA